MNSTSTIPLEERHESVTVLKVDHGRCSNMILEIQYFHVFLFCVPTKCPFLVTDASNFLMNGSVPRCSFNCNTHETSKLPVRAVVVFPAVDKVDISRVSRVA